MAGRTAPRPPRDFAADFTPMRKLRRYHELTQGQLARAAGLHWTTVWRIENGKTVNPGVLDVLALMRALSVPWSDLLTVIDRPKEP